MSSTINTRSINDILADVVETNTKYGISDADIEAIGNYNLEDDYHLSLDTT